MYCGLGPCAVLVCPTGYEKEFEAMSENAAKQSLGARDAARQGSGTAESGTTHGVPQPHFASRSPKVLARVPDLESAESGAIERPRSARRDGHMLGPRLSMLILVGGGGLLLAAALGLPFLLDDSEPADTASEEVPAWPLEPPAPSASVAPMWPGASEQPPPWQLPADGTAAPESELSAAPAWNDSPQSADWGEPSPARAWESPSPTPPWASRPAAQAWSGELPASVQDGEPSAAVGVPPADGSPWNHRAETLPGADREPAGWGQQEPRAPFWPVAPNGTVGQGQAPSAAPDGPILFPSAAAGPDYRQDPRAEYRAADARANLPQSYRADDSTGYQRTLPVAESVRSGYPPFSYPQTSYPGATYPVAGQSATKDPGSEARSTHGPISSHPTMGPLYDPAPAPRYGAQPAARYQEPGVARLQGAIERPTESNVYDHYRSSIH